MSKMKKFISYAIFTLPILCYSQSSQLNGFIFIKGGTFQSGDIVTEINRPHVRVEDFEILDHPVTNGEYKRFVVATKHPAPLHWKGSQIPAGKENYPVIFVNRHDVKAYLKWEGDGHPLLEFRIPRRQSKPQRFLRPDQLELLLAACDSCHKIMAVRNRAMILTLWDTLLRSSEIVRIQLYHLDLSLKMLRVDTKATNGKGRTWETKVFSSRTAEAIKEYLEVRQHYSLVGDPYLFVSMTGTKLTQGGFRCVVKRLRKHVGFQVSPHDFRRGGAAHAVERGVPDRLVMQQGGWKTHSVFQRYTEGAKLTAYAHMLWD